MGFRNGAWATIWEKKMAKVEYYKDGKKESFKKPQIRISISKKNGDGTYKQTFNGWVDVAGEALEELAGVAIKEGEPLRKQLKSVDVENRCVTNRSDDSNAEATYTWYWTPIIWSFGKADDEEQNKKETVEPKPSAKVVEEDEDDDLPF